MLILAGLLAVLYFITARPITTADPASHQLMGLAASLATEHTAAIDHFVSATGGSFLNSPMQAFDLAYYAGHYYSASAPGAAFLAVPFYSLGVLFGDAGGSAFVSGLAALAGAGTLLLVYAIARRLGSAVASARFAVLALGLTSALWGEADRFSPAVFSLLLLSLVLWLVIPPLPAQILREGQTRLTGWRLVLLGLALGFGVVVDYPNLVWVILVIPYLIWHRRLSPFGWLMLGLTGLIGLLPLLVYNQQLFGRPWIFSYSFLLNAPDAHSLVGQFLKGFHSTNLQDTLLGYGRSLLGPVLEVLGVVGLVLLFRQRGKSSVTIFLVATMLVVWLSGLLRFNPGGGIMQADFVVGMLPALVVGLAVWHENFMFMTRLEKEWIPISLIAVLGLFYWVCWPGFAPNFGAVVYLLPLAGLVLVGGLIWRFLPVMRWQKSFTLLGLLILLGVILTLLASPGRPAFAANGNNDLLTNGSLQCQGATVSGWYLGKQPLVCPASGKLTLTSGQQLQPYLVPVQGGKVYQVQFDSALPGQLSWLWLDDGQHAIQLAGGESTSNFCNGCNYRDQRAAPPGAAYLRLVFAATGAGSLANFHLFDDGVRLEPMPNYAKAALAFSFDWESAMGGLIHSKGGAPTDDADSGGDAGSLNAISGENVQAALADSVNRGLAMRQGADYLMKIFAQYKVSGTFYATGYNLLDGNRDHHVFVNNPIYKWASPKNGWTDYWLSHTWYSNDPFGDYKSDPAWYFGDQTDHLKAAGQDIESHTFGHLYVRGTTIQEFTDDMETFLEYADLKDLPQPRQFAFPWKSSNSVGPAWYNWMADHGFQSITRLYDYQQGIQEDSTGLLRFDTGELTISHTVIYSSTIGPNNAYYYLSQAPGEPRLFALHDYQLVPGPASDQQAANLINELLQRRGYGSVWTHPEAIVTPGDQLSWARVVDYATQQRPKGLWVDSVANIIGYRFDMTKVGVESHWSDNGHKLTLTLTNPTDHALNGVTLTLPASAKSVSGGASFQGAQVLAPTLPAGQSLSLEVEL